MNECCSALLALTDKLAQSPDDARRLLQVRAAALATASLFHHPSFTSVCLSSRRCLTRSSTPPCSPSYPTSCPGSSSSSPSPTSNRCSVEPETVRPVLFCVCFVFMYPSIHEGLCHLCQAASWLDAAPSGLEDCLQEADKDDLRELLTNQSRLQGQALTAGNKPPRTKPVKQESDSVLMICNDLLP